MKKVLKAYKIEETNTYLVKIPYGDYKIKGKILSLDKDTEFNLTEQELYNICSVNRVKTIVKYVFADIKLTVDEYNEKINNYKKEGGYNEENDNWDNIDIEYKYKKFKQNFKPVYKYFNVISDPFLVDITDVKINTNHKFIENIFNFGNKNIYKYYRKKHLMYFIKKTLEDLGYTYSQYKSGPKLYSMSQRTPIYVSINNTYIIDKEYDFDSEYLYNDNLNKLIEQANNYESEIKEKINNYILSTKPIDISNYKFENMFEQINYIVSNLQQYQFYNSYKNMCNNFKNRATDIKNEILEIINQQK